VLHPWSVHVGFVVNKVALGQVFLQVLWFSPVNIFPLILRTLLIHLLPTLYTVIPFSVHAQTNVIYLTLLFCSCVHINS